MNKALAHATCAFEASFGDGARNFDASFLGRSVWGGVATHKLIIEPNAKFEAQVRPKDEAIARPKMAIVLERLGRSSEAQRQLDEAVRISGVHNAAPWRDIALKTISLAAPGTGER